MVARVRARERESARAREREETHTQTAQVRVLITGKQIFQQVIFQWRFRFRVIVFFFRKLSFCTKGFGRLICENGLASRKTVRCLLPASLLCASAVVDFIFIFLWEKEVARLPGRCWNFRNPCRLIFGERLFLVRIGLHYVRCSNVFALQLFCVLVEREEERKKQLFSATTFDLCHS